MAIEVVDLAMKDDDFPDEALPLHQAPATSLPSLDSQEAPRNFRLASSPLRWAVDGLLALERKQLQVRTCNSEPDRQKDLNVQVQKMRGYISTPP